MGIEQWVIAILGTGSVVFTQFKPLERFACLLGLLAQPAFFYAAFLSSQPGLFFVSFVCLITWSWGFYRHWIRKTYEKDYNKVSHNILNDFMVDMEGKRFDDALECPIKQFMWHEPFETSSKMIQNFKPLLPKPPKGIILRD